MSVVTNYILAFGCSEDGGERPGEKHDVIRNIEDNYSILSGSPKIHFVRVDQHAEGSKAMEATVYIAAQNYSHVDWVITAVRLGMWRDIEAVTFLIKKQDDDHFHQVLMKVVEAPPPAMELQAETDEKHMAAWLASIGQRRYMHGREVVVVGCDPIPDRPGKYVVRSVIA